MKAIYITLILQYIKGGDTIMRYTVHYSGYYGYDVDVEASDENEAKQIADAIFDEEEDMSTFTFIPDFVEVMEV